MVNFALWVVQGLLAAVFLSSGMAKSVMSRERLRQTGQTGAAVMPMPFVRFVAVCEMLGAVGLVLPLWLGVAPVLTPVAAACLGILMVGAARIHLRLREPRSVAANMVLLGLCAFVAWGRLA